MMQCEQQKRPVNGEHEANKDGRRFFIELEPLNSQLPINLRRILSYSGPCLQSMGLCLKQRHFTFEHVAVSLYTHRKSRIKFQEAVSRMVFVMVL
jgi:hypothetical protein